MGNPLVSIIPFSQDGARRSNMRQQSTTKCCKRFLFDMPATPSSEQDEKCVAVGVSGDAWSDQQYRFNITRDGPN
jgi:hypothetical protein